MTQILIHNTNGNDNIERASLAFIVANTAVASGQETTVLLTINGVFTAQKGYVTDQQADGFPPLATLIDNYVAAGGNLWVCGACSKPREITSDQLIDGAEMVGAATAVEALVSGAQTLGF